MLWSNEFDSLFFAKSFDSTFIWHTKLHLHLYYTRNWNRKYVFGVLLHCFPSIWYHIHLFCSICTHTNRQHYNECVCVYFALARSIFFELWVFHSVSIHKFVFVLRCSDYICLFCCLLSPNKMKNRTKSIRFRLVSPFSSTLRSFASLCIMFLIEWLFQLLHQYNTDFFVRADGENERKANNVNRSTNMQTKMPQCKRVCHLTRLCINICVVTWSDTNKSTNTSSNNSSNNVMCAPENEIRQFQLLLPDNPVHALKCLVFCCRCNTNVTWFEKHARYVWAVGCTKKATKLRLRYKRW